MPRRRSSHAVHAVECQGERDGNASAAAHHDASDDRKERGESTRYAPSPAASWLERISHASMDHAVLFDTSSCVFLARHVRLWLTRT